MKSNMDALRKRGYISSEDTVKYQQLSADELFLMIQSADPAVRSSAVRILSNRFTTENPDFVKVLLKRLCVAKRSITLIGNAI